jgi:glycosyltransferase involved in cell wall biosynthesis
MEAQSFGIPVIATDTGGVGELVKSGTGTIIPISFKVEELSQWITYYATLSNTEIENLRSNSFNNWFKYFNASSNYRDFITSLNSIFAITNMEKF